MHSAVKEPTVLIRNGKLTPMFLPPKDDEELERLVLVYSRRFQALLVKSRRSISMGKGVSHGKFWKTVSASYDSRASVQEMNRHSKKKK
jgi:hypothetical protein